MIHPSVDHISLIHSSIFHSIHSYIHPIPIIQFIPSSIYYSVIRYTFSIDQSSIHTSIHTFIISVIHLLLHCSFLHDPSISSSLLIFFHSYSFIPLIHSSIIHWSIHWSIHSFFHSFIIIFRNIRHFMHSSIHHSSIHHHHPLIHHPFIHPFMLPFIRSNISYHPSFSCIRPFIIIIHWYIHEFFHSFFHSF